MTSVLLLRGINVGGAGMLPMADLKAALSAAGVERVETYIQSGNAVFEGTPSDSAIADEIEARAGFRPRLVLLSGDAFLDILDACPFRAEAEVDPKTVHFYFLASESGAREDDLSSETDNGERIALAKRVLYLHAPRYIGTSKFVARLDRLLGVPATGRNWRTTTKIAEMVEKRR